MKTIDIGVWKVGLTALYGEYNCGNKTTGRLKLMVTDGKSNTNHGEQQVIKELQDDKVRDKIVTNFLEDVASSATYGSLNKGCAYFPGDTGVYPPGVLVYADRIALNQSTTWYNNWKGLIELFEKEPKFGVVVLKSPIIPNKYYGASAPSRVWTLVLPSISKHVCFDKKSVTSEMKESLKQLITNHYTDDHLNKELKELGIAA